MHRVKAASYTNICLELSPIFGEDCLRLCGGLQFLAEILPYKLEPNLYQSWLSMLLAGNPNGICQEPGRQVSSPVANSIRGPVGGTGGYRGLSQQVARGARRPRYVPGTSVILGRVVPQGREENARLSRCSGPFDQQPSWPSASLEIRSTPAWDGYERCPGTCRVPVLTLLVGD